MSPSTAIVLAVLAPFGGAILITLADRWPNLRETVTLVTALVLFALVASLYPMVADGARPEALLAEVFPGLALRFQVEPLGMLFALIASFLWIITSLYAFGYMRAHREIHQTRFYALFAVSLGCAMGVAFAANMFTLFIFYEALTLSTYPLVVHHGTDEARRAGRVYLGLLLGTSIGLQLAAVIWTWSLAGTLDFTPGGILGDEVSPAVVGVLFALYAFGIGKAALMPFHRWLPAAMVAPTPVSALLHAVAVVKAGVFAILKVTVYLFGIDLLGTLQSHVGLMYAAAATLVIASLVALRQDNLKLRLAYSTVSQLAYVVLGATLANPWGVIGGGMHIAMHAFGKITLFFCAGAIMIATHKTEVSQLNGIGRTMPFTMVAFLVASLSVIGLPPFGGLWSKWYLALGTLAAGQYVMLGVLMLGTLLSAGYLLPVIARSFFAAPANPGHHEAGRIREAPAVCVVALLVSAAGCLALFLWPGPVFALLAQIVTVPG